MLNRVILNPYGLASSRTWRQAVLEWGRYTFCSKMTLEHQEKEAVKDINDQFALKIGMKGVLK